MKRMPKLPEFVSDVGIFLLKSFGWIVIGVLVVFIASYFVKLPSNRAELFSLIEVLFGIVITALTIVASFVVAFQWNVIESNRRALEDMTKKQEENVKNLEATIAQIQNEIVVLTQKVDKAINQTYQKLDEELEQLVKRIDTESQKYIEASYYYSEGTKNYRAGDNKHAIENYLQALKYEPKSPRILERIGRAYTNLNEEEKAIEYLRLALDLDPENEPVLRSLALYYRYSNNQEAIKLLKRIVDKNPEAYESWDFLGLCYRDQLQQGQLLIKDQEIIDKAIQAHENALKIRKRPETEFYLGILLFFSPTGDKNRARDLLLSAAKRVEEQEHDVRMRSVWKMLILAGALIVEGNLAEALKYIQDMIKYNPSQRIFLGVESHLRFLLNGTGHSDWMQAFLDILNTWKGS